MARSAGHRTFCALALAGTVAAFGAGCSAQKDAAPQPSPSSTPTAVPAQPSATQDVQADTPAPSPSPEGTESAAAPDQTLPSPSLTDAFPGWGAGMPAVAMEASVPGTWYTGEHVLVNPDGDIHVLLFGDQAWIYSQNWTELQPYGASANGNINNGVVLAGGAAPDSVAAYEEWPLGAPEEEDGPYRDPEVIPYETPIYFGSYVCGATAQGVTCWNIDTGHGAFVTRTGFTAF